jgi:hypothetical protein
MTHYLLMIEKLEILADQIASLRALVEEADDEGAKASIEYYAALFAEVLDYMAEQECALNGEMPWVKDFVKPSTDH